MAECQCVHGCPFFEERMASTPAMVKMIKSQYCTGPRASNRRCARYVVHEALGARQVPDDLYPAQYERAVRILRAASQDPPS